MKANRGDKIICIKAGFCEFITIGKIYEVLDITDDVNFYFIVNNYGVGSYYSIGCFMKLNEWREQQINKIL